MCRRTHGHLGAYSNTPLEAFRLTEDRGLAWYESSAQARRGFCNICGASLFYAPSDNSRMAMSAGSLDEPTGITTELHLFTADAGDYYSLDDALPKYETWPGDQG